MSDPIGTTIQLILSPISAPLLHRLQRRRRLVLFVQSKRPEATVIYHGLDRIAVPSFKRLEL
jgi:hypothetical protein